MYNSPREAELNALNKCGALLEELDGNAKVRVLKYLVEMFDLAKFLQMSDNAEKASNNHADGDKLEPPKLLSNSDESKLKSRGDIGEDIEGEDIEDNYPTIRDIVMRDLPKVESEWVLVYAFYASKFAQELFTRENLIEKYNESGRYDAQRIKNLSGNFKANILKKWIKGVNDTTYRVTPEGKKYAEQILEGKSEGKPKAQPKKKVIKANKE